MRCFPDTSVILCRHIQIITRLPCHSASSHPGRTIAAVLTGVGGGSTDAAAVPCWRGRLEVRSDDEGVLR